MMEREKIGLKELQKLTLDLIIEFDAFCQKNDIKYVLGGGSMLGAIRHKGFIPWDDDMDVMMLREEYDKLLKAAEKAAKEPSDSEDGLKTDRRFISPYDRTFARNFARYVRCDYTKHEEGFEEDDCPWIGIDIFPIDFVPGDDRFKKQMKQVRFWRKMLLFSLTVPNSGKSKAKKIAKNIIRPFTKLIGSYNMALKMDKIAMEYADGDRTYIAAVCGMYGDRERWKLEEYLPQVRVPFEGVLLPVPKNYDIYLDEPLRCIGENCDYIDLINKKVVRKINTITFTGTESWSKMKDGTSKDISEFYYSIDNTIEDSSKVYVMSNYFQSHSRSEIWNKNLGISASSKYIRITQGVDDKFNYDIDTFKTWLEEKNSAGNPLVVNYVMKNTKEEYIDLPDIKDLNNKNIFISDNTLTTTIEKE